MDGYTHTKLVKWKDTQVLCGIARMAFTTGLFMGIDKIGYIGRYCFHTHSEAVKVLEELNEIPEGLIIPGNWIKFKGTKEMKNPNYQETDERDISIFDLSLLQSRT